MRRKRLILGAATAGRRPRSRCSLGGVFHDSSAATADAAAIAPAASTGALQAGFSPAATARRRRREAAGDAARRIRTTCTRSTSSGSPTSSGRARPAIRPTTRSRSRRCTRALRLAPRDLIATSGLGSLALSRHRFAEALVLGRKAHAISPTTALQLRRHRRRARRARPLPGGFRGLRHDGDAASPSLSSYARVAHARDLLGRVPEAIETMKLAVDAAAGAGRAGGLDARPARQALLVDRPRRRGRARKIARALRAFPGYHSRSTRSPGRGARRGTTAPRSRSSSRPSTGSRCRSTSRSSATSTARTARRRRRGKQYALIGVIERLLVANGVKTDLETALFDVDHGIRLPRALALARTARAERPSIDGDDVLAWALDRNGHCGEALAPLEAARSGSGRATRSRSSIAG